MAHLKNEVEARSGWLEKEEHNLKALSAQEPSYRSLRACLSASNLLSNFAVG